MGYRESETVAAVTTASTTTIGAAKLGTAFGVIKGAIVRNWASSAKAAAGTDAAQKLKLTDARGVVFYYDAADRDYKTATVYLAITGDDTATGLGYVPVDATGAAASAGSKAEFVAKSPVTVTVEDAGTATDYFEVTLLVNS